MRYKEDWTETEAVMAAWWEGHLERPVVQAFAPADGIIDYPGLDGWAFLRYKNDPERVLRDFERFAESTFFGGEAFPNCWVNLGPGVLSAYFSDFLEFDNENSTSWFEKPVPWETVEDYSFDPDNAWWKYTQEATRLAMEAGRDKWITATTDIGGYIDVLASFRGTENLLLDLVSEPERVLACRHKVERAWEKVYTTLYDIVRQGQAGTGAWMGLWCPGRWYPLQCDFCAMISPAMFEEFVAPNLRAQCKWLDYSVYHLDGPGQIPHLDILLDMPELNAIQWVPGSGVPQCDSPQWFEMYERILSKGKGLILQGWDDPWKAVPMLDQIPHKGVFMTTWFPTQAEATDYLKATRGH